VRLDCAIENTGSAQDIDADGFATALSVTTTTGGTSGTINRSTFIFDTTEIDSLTDAEQAIRIKITRDANHAADTMVGDLQLKLVVVRELP
jgi:hypothetical protein